MLRCKYNGCMAGRGSACRLIGSRSRPLAPLLLESSMMASRRERLGIGKPAGPRLQPIAARGRAADARAIRRAARPIATLEGSVSMRDPDQTKVDVRHSPVPRRTRTSARSCPNPITGRTRAAQRGTA